MTKGERRFLAVAPLPLVGGALGLGFLWIFVAISLNMFSIHQ